MKICVVIFKHFIIIIFNNTKQTLHLEKTKPTLIFKTDNKNVKKPTNLRNGVFLTYAPKKNTIEPMQFVRNDMEVTVTLPKEHRGCFTSKFRHDEIETITDLQQIIWIGMLNRFLRRILRYTKTRPFWIFL